MDNLNELMDYSQSYNNSDLDIKENICNKNIEKKNNNSKLIDERQLNSTINNLENKFQNNIYRLEQNIITAIKSLQKFKY